MTLVTHQLQGPCTTFPLRPSSWSRGIKLKQHLTTLQVIGRTDRRLLVKRNLHLSAGAYIHGSKLKISKFWAFKGNSQNDESRKRANGSKCSKNTVKLSYVPTDNGETIMESPKVHSAPVSHTSKGEGINGSPAIHRLFKKWLNMLCTQPPCEEEDGTLKRHSASEELQEPQSNIQDKERGGILKNVWCSITGLDATIKIPLLVFIPLYLVINVFCGAEVSKELTPLWILGPLVVALYIKMIRGLWALYVFTFRQTVKVIKNLPTYYLVAAGYVKQGKLKDDVKARVLQPVIKVKNMDFDEFSRKNLKVLEEWLMEKYLDFVESIWPYYCRTIRFLKRANLI
ncbi:hypothetical protein K2173_026971 [Erythroxylum novogranatense]|uniref:Embryo defective 2759 n=1 Tax=Erythroxylum novogranatense TaxID=1862640 RepID=A0AAV8U0Y6_9ROSI|nr:hypothetical protein K2173_026971 [Erythroxylum novogranatense]